MNTQFEHHFSKVFSSVFFGVLVFSFGIFGAMSFVAGLYAGLLCFLAVWVAYFTLTRPLFVTGFLFFYFSLEPFLLQFVPNVYYPHVRFGSEGVIYLLFAFALWKLLTRQVRWKSTIFDVLFLSLLLSMIAATFIHWPGFTISAFGWRGIVRFILLYPVVLVFKPTRQHITFFGMALLVFLGFESALGITQWLMKGALDQFLAPTAARYFGDITLTVGTQLQWAPGQRVFATLGRYEQFGTWLMMLLLSLTAILYERFSKASKFRLGVLGALAFLALLLTYSRTSWFGFLIGVFFIGVLIKKDRSLLWLAAAALLALLSYQYISGLVVNTLADEANNYERVSMSERFYEAFSYERWRAEYLGIGRVFFMVETPRQVIVKSPLFGFGPGQYGSGAAAGLHNTTVYDIAGIPFGVWGIYGIIDNSWMSLWGEIGTIGVLLYGFVWLCGFRLAFFLYRESTYLVTRTVALAALGIFPACAFAGFLATFFEMRTFGPYVWVLLGTLVVLAQSEGVARQALYQFFPFFRKQYENSPR